MDKILEKTIQELKDPEYVKQVEAEIEEVKKTAEPLTDAQIYKNYEAIVKNGKF